MTPDGTYEDGLRDGRIESVEKVLTEISADVKQLVSDVSALKVKAGVWGALGGVAASLTTITVGIIIWIIKG